MPKKNSEISKDATAVILAGGRGKRVGGKDKGLLKWKKEPLIVHAYRRINPQVDRVIVSCNRNLELYKNVADIVVQDERDSYWGPLAGIESSTKLVNSSHAIVIPCDAPSLPIDLVERLIDTLKTTNDSEVTYAWDGVRSQFLFTAIKREVFSTITNCLNAGGRSLRDWHSYVKACSVDFSDKVSDFENINHEFQLH